MTQERKNLLVFGFGLALILTFFGLRIGFVNSWPIVSFVLLGAALVFVMISLGNISLLKPLYAVWMNVAHVIGGMIFSIILAAIFYGLFALVGLFLRLQRKDILNQKIDHASPTYWIKRESISFDKKSYQKQF